jgi:hypothetical protein
MDGTTEKLAVAPIADSSLLWGMLRLVRPKDWIKNAFILISLQFTWGLTRESPGASEFNLIMKFGNLV